jgi:hypothetical protein
MSSESMDRLGFLIGKWKLAYRIPESPFSPARSDNGIGSFRKVLQDQYVIFEYSTDSGGAAMGIFAWDEKAKIYRYWWFENSGSFMEATCTFIDDKTLCMNWHDSIFTQTFAKDQDDRIILTMQYPSGNNSHLTVLEVILTREPK